MHDRRVSGPDSLSGHCTTDLKRPGGHRAPAAETGSFSPKSIAVRGFRFALGPGTYKKVVHAGFAARMVGRKPQHGETGSSIEKFGHPAMGIIKVHQAF